MYYLYSSITAPPKVDDFQEYIFGICKALHKYDISTGVPFLIFKEFYVKNEIDNYIRTMRQGYSVQSIDEYRTLKTALTKSCGKN